MRVIDLMAHLSAMDEQATVHIEDYLECERVFGVAMVKEREDASVVIVPDP